MEVLVFLARLDGPTGVFFTLERAAEVVVGVGRVELDTLEALRFVFGWEVVDCEATAVGLEVLRFLVAISSSMSLGPSALETADESGESES